MLWSLLAVLTEPGWPVGVLFGNHDLWVPDPKPGTAWEILERFCDAADANGAVPLDRRAMAVGDTWIVGSGCWYDYSLGSALWSNTQYSMKKLNGLVVQDLEYVDFDMADSDVCAALLRRLDLILKTIPSNSEIVAASHMCALPGSLPKSDATRDLFLNAFWGSKAIGALLATHGIRTHFHGHVHSSRRHVPDAAEDRATGLISYNACFYRDRPFLLAEKDDDWTIRVGSWG
jgi:hypothetical protein